MRVAADFARDGFEVEAEAVIEATTRDYPGSIDFEDYVVYVYIKRGGAVESVVASDELQAMILAQFEDEIFEKLSQDVSDGGSEDGYYDDDDRR